MYYEYNKKLVCVFAFLLSAFNEYKFLLTSIYFFINLLIKFRNIL